MNDPRSSDTEWHYCNTGIFLVLFELKSNLFIGNVLSYKAEAR